MLLVYWSRLVKGMRRRREKRLKYFVWFESPFFNEIMHDNLSNVSVDSMINVVNETPNIGNTDVTVTLDGSWQRKNIYISTLFCMQHHWKAIMLSTSNTYPSIAL